MSPVHYSLTFSLLAHSLVLIPVVLALTNPSPYPETLSRSLNITLVQPARRGPLPEEKGVPAKTNNSTQTAVAESEQTLTAEVIKPRVETVPAEKSSAEINIAKRATNLKKIPPPPEVDPAKPSQTTASVRKPNRGEKSTMTKEQNPAPPRQPLPEERAREDRTSTTAAQQEDPAPLTTPEINRLAATASAAVIIPESNLPDTQALERLARLESKYRADVENAIRSAKKYPLWARRKSLQGVAKVEFTVHHNGKIDEIALTDPSGHPTLDRAALAAVSDLGSVKPIPLELARLEWRFKIPLNFQLQ